MAKFNFNINLPAQSNDLIKIATDYENMINYLPTQVKSFKIIDRSDKETITEERIVISSIFKNAIEQQSIHRKVSPVELITKITSGVAKNSEIRYKFEPVNDGTKVSIDMELKLSLKVRILLPIIKKKYKLLLTGILYKMNTVALEKS